LHAEEGREALARAELEQMAAHEFADLRRDGTLLIRLVALAELVAALVDAPRARLLYPLLHPYEDRNISTMIGGVCHGSPGRYLGPLAATAGATDAAVGHFETALLANQRMGALPQLARTQADLARLLLGRGRPGDVERGRELLERARDTAEALGMHRF